MNLRTKGKWIIGLTGSMLSGKSTALAAFAHCGAGVLSADDIVASLYTRPAVQRALKTAFGTADKTELARLVFADEFQRKKLENLLHPLVFKEMRARIRQLPQTLIVVEVPLLFEAGWNEYTDLNIVVLADPKTLPARLKERRLTRAEYQRRISTQWPDAQKAARAEVVFYHATKAELENRVRHFCNSFEVLQK